MSKVPRWMVAGFIAGVSALALAQGSIYLEPAGRIGRLADAIPAIVASALLSPGFVAVRAMGIDPDRTPVATRIVAYSTTFGFFPVFGALFGSGRRALALALGVPTLVVLWGVFLFV